MKTRLPLCVRYIPQLVPYLRRRRRRVYYTLHFIWNSPRVRCPFLYNKVEEKKNTFFGVSPTQVFLINWITFKTGLACSRTVYIILCNILYKDHHICMCEQIPKDIIRNVEFDEKKTRMCFVWTHARCDVLNWGSHMCERRKYFCGKILRQLSLFSIPIEFWISFYIRTQYIKLKIN